VRDGGGHAPQSSETLGTLERRVERVGFPLRGREARAELVHGDDDAIQLSVARSLDLG
jgi:hypothetical protein